MTTLASLPNIGIYNVYVNVSIVDGPPSKTGWSIVENVGIDTTEHDYVQRITYLIDGVSYVRGMNNKTALSSWKRVYDTSILTDSTVLSPLASALGASIGIRVVYFDLSNNGSSYTTLFGCFWVFIGRMQGAARAAYVIKYNTVSTLFEEQNFPISVSASRGEVTITNMSDSREDGYLYCFSY